MIYFKFAGEDFWKYGGPKTPVGWIAVRDHGLFNDGTPLLSPDCTSVEQIEFHAVMLKREIDEAVKQAKRKLPNSN